MVLVLVTLSARWTWGWTVCVVVAMCAGLVLLGWGWKANTRPAVILSIAMGLGVWIGFAANVRPVPMGIGSTLIPVFAVIIVSWWAPSSNLADLKGRSDKVWSLGAFSAVTFAFGYALWFLPTHKQLGEVPSGDFVP